MKTKTLNILLWIAQFALAAMFIMTGSMKLFQPIEEIAKTLPWVANTSARIVRFIGISEFLGGIGLILPTLLRIKPKLSGLAALGLAVVMLFASIFHIYRGEYSAIGMTLIIGLIAYFIFWGRTIKAPVTSK